eukprot:1098808-Pyramimonas_sp.AAC.1
MTWATCRLNPLRPPRSVTLRIPKAPSALATGIASAEGTTEEGPTGPGRCATRTIRAAPHASRRRP